MLQKQPIIEEADKTASILTKNDKDESAGGFPVTNILSGIYSLVSSYIKPTEEEQSDLVEPITAIPQSAINVHNMPRDQLIVEAIEDFQAPPLPILPPEYLRGGPIGQVSHQRVITVVNFIFLCRIQGPGIFCWLPL